MFPPNASDRIKAELQPDFPALDSVTNPTVPTAQAAHYMDRSVQTLRVWACYNTGPITPLKVGGRLAWPIRDIRKLYGVDK